MLPDGGVKLEKQVSDLTQQICQLDLALERDKKVLDALPAPTPGRSHRVTRRCWTPCPPPPQVGLIE